MYLSDILILSCNLGSRAGNVHTFAVFQRKAFLSGCSCLPEILTSKQCLKPYTVISTGEYGINNFQIFKDTNMKNKYEVVIGLEVHSQIKTETKFFATVPLIFIRSRIRIFGMAPDSLSITCFKQKP